MTFHRLAAAGMGLAAVLTFATAGCADSTADSNDKGSGTKTTAADPATTLTQAADKLAKTSFKLTMKMTSKDGDAGQMVAVMDKPNKLGKTTTTIASEGSVMKMETMYIGSDLYTKMTMDGKALLSEDAGKWNRIDTGRLPEDNTLGLKAGDFDPSGSAVYFRAAVKVQRVDEHHFSGTFDASKAVDASTLTKKDVAKLGPAGKAVPFTATTDSEGRLVEMMIDMPAIGEDPATKMTATYSDFGAPASITKPAASEVTDANDAIYEMFKG